MSCRCPWVDLGKLDYVEYHDREWGVPIHEDRLLFEFLTLESAQAGLSWYTVLRKRANYRIAFDDFQPEIVAGYGPAKMNELMLNAGIIRNRLKIEAAVQNANRFVEVQSQYGSFSRYMWDFVGGKPIVHDIRGPKDYPSSSPESDAFCKDLKRKGFKFLGTTVCYAHMQATGMINDHSNDCFRKEQIIRSYPSKGEPSP